MEDIEGTEIDPAIAEAMGFSGFGTQPGHKRKYNPNNGYVDPAVANSAAKETNEQKQSMASVKQPFDDTEISRNPPTNAVQPSGGNENSTLERAKATVKPNTTVITNTGLSSDVDGSDAKSLQALREGVRNANGDMVYFLPSFLEDPWERLQPRQGHIQ